MPFFQMFSVMEMLSLDEILHPCPSLRLAGLPHEAAQRLCVATGGDRGGPVLQGTAWQPWVSYEVSLGLVEVKLRL